MIDDDVVQERTPHRRLGAVVRLVLVACCFIALWLLLKNINLDLVVNSVSSARRWPLLLAICLNLGSQVLRATTWKVLLNASNPVRMRRLVHYEFIAQAATALSPEGTGELLRLQLLKRDGVPMATTGALIGARKLFSSLGLVPFAIALPWAAPTLPSWALLVVYAYAGLLTVLFIGLCIIVRRPRRSGRKGRLSRMLDGLKPLEQWRVTVLSLLIAAGTRATDIMAAVLIGVAIHLQASITLAVFALLLVEVSSLLPAAPAQLGTFEAAVVTAATVLQHLGKASSLTFAVLLHAQQVLPQIIVGLAPLLVVLKGPRNPITPRRWMRHGHGVG